VTQLHYPYATKQKPMSQVLKSDHVNLSRTHLVNTTLHKLYKLLKKKQNTPRANR